MATDPVPGVLDDLVRRRAPAVGTGHDRTRLLCGHLGLDPTVLPTIHVTGTNGKTSTAWMIDALLRAAGLATMRFTSPHLQRVGERIAIDGVALGDADVAVRWAGVAPAVAAVEAAGVVPGFFDVMTTLFVDLAIERRPDVAIVEVGRRGRDDATNVVAADVAVFTPIGGDHDDVGGTRTSLARAKLGIVTHGGRRPAGPHLVSARQEPDVAGLVARTACARGLELTTVGTRTDLPPPEPTAAGQRVTMASTTGRHHQLDLPVHGPHQADNAAVALAAAESFLGASLDTVTVQAGLAALSTPGRLEVGQVDGTTVRLDGAHNPAGAEALAAALGPDTPTGPRVLVIGCGDTKDLDGILAALADRVDAVVATGVASPGAAAPATVAAAAGRVGLPVEVVADPGSALDRAVALARFGGEVLVTGSLYLVGALRERVVHPVPDVTADQAAVSVPPAATRHLAATPA